MKVEEVGEPRARAMLWRRETRRTGNPPYDTARNDLGPNQVEVARLDNFAGIDAVLYTRIGANILSRTAERLAELAVASAKSIEVPEGQDGISYVAATLRNGVRTPLSDAYAAEIKRQTGTTSLDQALKIARGHRPAG